MKKIMKSLAAITLLSSFAFAEDVKFSFYNKVYEEDAVVSHSDEEDKTTKDFPGIKERMEATAESEKVDAYIKATVTLDDYDDKHFALQGKLNDWYVAFRPVQQISLDMHKNTFADGSYLPIYDDNVGAANLGSTGFSAIVTPIENLRLGFTAPFEFDGSDPKENPDKANWIDGKEEDGEQEDFNAGFGAIYDAELFQIGGAIQDALDDDERQIGGYINLPGLLGAVEPLTIGAGFAHSENWKTAFDDLISVGIESGLEYRDLLSAYASFDAGKFALNGELLYNMGDDDKSEVYDLYSAASLSIEVIEKLTATATGKILVDLEDKDETQKSIKMGAFALDYAFNEKNTFGAEVDVAMKDKDWAVAVPVYWKYSF